MATSKSLISDSQNSTEQYDQTNEARGADNVDISSGVVMGTVKYMSPEQARGLRVDQRSDIFSLGVVIFEMLAGCTPFEGKTASDLVHSITQAEPPSLASLQPTIPVKLDVIVKRALSKNREQRYATRDLLAELKGLREELELESRFGRDRSLTSLTRLVARQAAQHKIRSALVLIGLAIAIGSLLYFSVKWFSRRPPFQKIAMAQITGTQYSGYGAISPDGKYLAHVADERGQRSLWIRKLGTNDQTQLFLLPGLFMWE